MVTVHVGEQRHQFLIHKELLCHHSSFFRATFQGSFIEASSGNVELPDDDVEVFKIFESWLYTGSVGLMSNVAGHQPSKLVKLYILADKIEIPAIQKETLETLRERAVRNLDLCDPDTIHLAFENTPPGSPLRRLLVDVFAYNANPESWQEDFLQL